MIVKMGKCQKVRTKEKQKNIETQRDYFVMSLIILMTRLNL